MKRSKVSVQLKTTFKIDLEPLLNTLNVSLTTPEPSRRSIENDPEDSPRDSKNSGSFKEDWDNEWDWDNDQKKKPPAKTMRSPPFASPKYPQYMYIFAYNYRQLDVKKANLAVSRSGHFLVVGCNEKLMFVKKGEPLPLIVDQQIEEGDVVTQVAIIPLIHQKTTYDCVAVGYKSGYLKMFTNTGELLLSQLLHRAPVIKLKLRTSPGLEGPLGQQTEDFCIVYPEGIVTCIDGLSLYSILSNYLLQLEKGYKDATDTTLSYRKWKLEDQELLTDVVTIALSGPSPFGSLHPLSSSFRLYGVGKDPMLSFYVPSEKEFRFSTAVALASTMATKLTSAVFSLAVNWWTRGSQQPVQQEPQEKEIKIEKAHSLAIKWGMSDPQRTIQSIVLDPTGRLAAATDGFGRVLLLDTVDNIVVRMWKGYRDAQCGFLQWESSFKTEPFTMFLAIYAPRRGILEVWRVRSGPREAIMDVGLGCKLLPTQTALGSATGNYVHARCFILQKDGHLQEIVVAKSSYDK